MSEVLVGLILLAVCMAGAMWFAAEACDNQWERSGMRSEWKLVGGCMVQIKDGTWIPAGRYREID